MTRVIKLLWVEDDLKFGPSVHFRIEGELGKISVKLSKPELLEDGQHVWITVRDWKPDIIMMDHNLSDVRINGANLITEIRFHNNDTPIIFYSSEMDNKLMELVEGHSNVITSTRGDVHSELVRLISEKFAGN